MFFCWARQGSFCVNPEFLQDELLTSHPEALNTKLVDTSSIQQQYQTHNKTYLTICFMIYWRQQEIFKLKAAAVSSSVFPASASAVTRITQQMFVE